MTLARDIQVRLLVQHASVRITTAQHEFACYTCFRQSISPTPIMTNLTISLDENIVRQARVRAIQQGTSLSAKIREFVAAFAAGKTQTVAVVDPTTHLMRVMAEVREEIARNTEQNPSAQSTGTGLRAPVARRTLRDDIYDGDFRARARGATDEDKA